MMLQTGFQRAVDVQPRMAASRPPCPQGCDKRIKYGCHLRSGKSKVRHLLACHGLKKGLEFFATCPREGVAIALCIRRAGGNCFQQGLAESLWQNFADAGPKRTYRLQGIVNTAGQSGNPLPVGCRQSAQRAGRMTGLLHLFPRCPKRPGPVSGHRLLRGKPQQGQFEQFACLSFLAVKQQGILHECRHRHRIGTAIRAADHVPQEPGKGGNGNRLTGAVVDLDTETLEFGGNPAG